MTELDSRRGTPRLAFETKGDASNEPLVLLHGFTGSRRTWDALTERLSQGRFLVLPDLPGHGLSALRHDDDAGLEATGVALERVLDEALSGDARKISLLGYSLGGRIALGFTLKHPQRVGSLVLESASPGILDASERDSRAARDNALATDIENRGLEWFVDYWQSTPTFAGQRDLDASVFQKLRRERLSNTAQGLAASLRSAGAGRMVPLWSRLQELTMNVLLVVGGRDEKFKRVGEAMNKMIPGSELVVVEGAGHCVHIEKPAEFGNTVTAFLDGRTPEGRR